jgi:pimeloyl-ACP methyl ester carboxylesterase
MASHIIKYNNISIHYTLQGQGKCLLLLHGYPDNHQVWNDASSAWKNQFKLLIPDIPGLGRSDTPWSAPSIFALAEHINQIIIHEKIEKCAIIGHSMGGYVAMALAQMNPEVIEKLVLVHSHPFADTQAKKNNRKREIKIIQEGRWEVLCDLTLPSRFSRDFQLLHPQKTALINQITKSAGSDGLCWLLEAMMYRNDCSEWLLNTCLPVLICSSPNDSMMDYNLLLKMFQSGKTITLTAFDRSQHMCFWEEPDKFYQVVSKFMSM